MILEPKAHLLTSLRLINWTQFDQVFTLILLPI